MKELSIEEKAKAYDEALEKLRNFYRDYDTVSCLIDVKEELANLFPELKESEDEKIRKNLINFLDAVWHLGKNANFDEHSKADCAEWISWLEKQEGCELIRKEWLEHIKQSWYKEGFINGKYGGGTSKEWTINDTTTLNELIDFLENGTAKLQHDLTRYANWLKIQLAPNVKPKFNVGEWITNSIETVQITGYDIDYGYQVDYKGNLQHRDTDIIEKEYHLWTIADAMDGDVLVTTFDEDNMIVMYHSMCTKDTINVHCCLDNKFVCWNLGVFDAEDVKPATKEQRDLLFQKMKEAGYEWDAEKKELKLLITNGGDFGPTWSEEDEYWHAFVAELLYGIEDSDKEYETKCRKAANWLKSLKERIGE